MINIGVNELLTGFVVPPVNGGQIIKVSYSTFEDGVIKKIYDMSDLTTEYFVAFWDDIEPMVFEPWNFEPAINNDCWQKASIV